MKQHSCVIIGAGLAGLAAAYRLTRKSWKVTVVEATERYGGRVLSHTFRQAKHLVCELGGEWIGEDHKEMRRLCKVFHLDLQDHRFCNGFMRNKRPLKNFAPGQWCMSAQAEKLFTAFGKQMQNFGRGQFRRMDRLDWWTQLQLLGFSEKDLLRRDLMDSTDSGESIRMTSAYSAATEYIGVGGTTPNDTDEMDFKVVGGNSRLVKALAHAIGTANIRTGYAVDHIRQGRYGVQVSAKGKSKVQADACICTVPAHFLRKIKWDPPLPKKQFEASEQLQYARIVKTAVLCADRFWPSPSVGGFSVFTDLVSDFCFDSTYGQPGKQGILCSYAIGDKADDIAYAVEQDLGEWIAGDVATAITGKKQKVMPEAVKRQAWQHDRYTGGSYAFYRPGQWFTVRKALMIPHESVFFAGEHLSDNWQGFMEGAVETGLAAAEKVARRAH